MYEKRRTWCSREKPRNEGSAVVIVRTYTVGRRR